MRRVVVESPFAGDVEANVAYARRCVLDCLRRGEAPYASHLFFTQPGLLDDTKADERRLGIEAGLAWGASAEIVAVYVDRGVSEGMKDGIARAVDRQATIGMPKIVIRSLENALEVGCSAISGDDRTTFFKKVLEQAETFAKLVRRKDRL